VHFKPKINLKTGSISPRASKFMVSYNTLQIAYAYGHNTGYSRENSYMEAARCLRFLLARDIQILDKSMGINVDIDDPCEFIDFNDDDDVTLSPNSNSIPVNTNTHLQPIINITNSNVTITPNRHIVYDDDDNIDFVFESPEGEFGALPSAGDDIEGLDFSDIIEI
jgi:hypothetical protein